MKKIDIHEHLIQTGFDISYSTFKRLTKEIEARHEEAFIRQEYEPGGACEFDWGTVKLDIGGSGYKKYQMAVFTAAVRLAEIQSGKLDDLTVLGHNGDLFHLYLRYKAHGYSIKDLFYERYRWPECWYRTNRNRDIHQSGLVVSFVRIGGSEMAGILKSFNIYMV